MLNANTVKKEPAYSMFKAFAAFMPSRLPDNTQIFFLKEALNIAQKFIVLIRKFLTSQKFLSN